MKKKLIQYIDLLVAIFIFFGLIGCVAETNETTRNKKDEVQLFGDTDSKNALRICWDVKTIHDGPEKAAEELVELLEMHYGIKDIVVEMIPAAGVERDLYVSRIRTEIMAGYGPDVFIVVPSGPRGLSGTEITEDLGALFPYPEKVMESGFFLPLDKYMENNSKLTDWNQQQQTVMEAGRNNEGQQIIPLTYTFPLLIFPQDKMQLDKPKSRLTWTDILADDTLMALYGDFMSCRVVPTMGSTNVGTEPYLDLILGELADFQNEELLFTEDELLQRIKEILELEDFEIPTEYGGTKALMDILTGSGYPQTYLPLYSDDGGISVSISSYAAVNRNTKRPEDAYSVIDLLMGEHTQQSSVLYNYCLSMNGIPMNTRIFSEDLPITNGKKFLIDENFKELQDIREQITSVSFHGILSMDLHLLLMKCRSPEVYDSTVEELVHETYVQMQRKVRE